MLWLDGPISEDVQSSYCSAGDWVFDHSHSNSIVCLFAYCLFVFADGMREMFDADPCFKTKKTEETFVMSL